VLEFLSHEWFAVVGSGLRDVELMPSASCRVMFDAEVVRWHLIIESGRFVSFGDGEIEEPDLELRWGRNDARDIVLRHTRGNDVLLRTTVLAQAADGPYVGPPAPLNLGSRSELLEMPRIPEATFTVQYRYQRGPFGDVSYALSFEDGRLARELVGHVADPDVTVEVSYRAMALVRAGEKTILEALDDGRVDGELGAMAMLAGISESREFHAAELGTGRHAVPLAALGELDASPTYAALMVELAATTAES
jgi:hypothetical protein